MAQHTLIPNDLFEQLLDNGRQQQVRIMADKPEIDFKPVVKLFTPSSGATWLLTELDPHEPDIAFGLCDLGQGFPELGNVSLTELKSVRLVGVPAVERDEHFQATKPLSEYAKEARQQQRIVT